MTPEELLLIDLCARLPYGVKVKCGSEILTFNVNWLQMFQHHLDEIKPYLRPMSSMTEEERDEYRKAIDKDFTILEDSLNAPISYKYPDGTVVRDRVLFNELDWLNKHHFDYRGLIPMGLALEAKKEMYKNE